MVCTVSSDAGSRVVCSALSVDREVGKEHVKKHVTISRSTVRHDRDDHAPDSGNAARLCMITTLSIYSFKKMHVANDGEMAERSKALA